MTITRRGRWYEGQLHPEESLSREQAIRFYTWNNAYLLRMESQVGSLEPGKQADLIALNVSDYRELPYYFGANHVHLTIKRGVILS